MDRKPRCKAKKFSTDEKAIVALAMIRRRGNPMANVRVFKCQECEFWHLGKVRIHGNR